jgi:hypothetical protein
MPVSAKKIKKWKKNSKNAGPKQTAAHKSDNGKPDIPIISKVDPSPNNPPNPHAGGHERPPI